MSCGLRALKAHSSELKARGIKCCCMKYVLLFLISLTLSLSAFKSIEFPFADALNGAWHFKEGSNEQVFSFVDGYFVHSLFDKANKKFNYTWGGPYEFNGNTLKVQVQFNSNDKTPIGSTIEFPAKLNGSTLSFSMNGRTMNFVQVDKGEGALAGAWWISGRKQGDQINERPLNTRRTLKILSGTRFQWAAINIDTKEFLGTGGGTYTFKDGKYTENIEFFSRDSSRVGASLSFDGKVESGAWHHSGLSSRGDPIYEIWRKLK
jgi:hypothetical protein